MLFLTSEMLKEAERRAMENVSAMQLIRNAACVCFEELKKYSSVCIFCGKGNNGSDGYATAILLKKNNIEVEIVQVYEPQTEECIALYKEAIDSGISVNADIPIDLNRFECIFDAIFGIGINGEVSGNALRAIMHINSAACTVVSADIPSGMNADTGNACGICVIADKTITFTAPKKGMLYNESVDVCGEIVICDVGIAVNYDDFPQSSCVPLYEKFVMNLLPKRSRLSHKGTFGNVVMIAGSSGMVGAAAIAAQAAYRTGCGLVKIIAPKSICGILNILIKEAVVIASNEKDGRLTSELTDNACMAIKTADSVLIGCGLGGNCHSELIKKVLTLTNVNTIIDADGINSLEESMEVVRNKNVLLTPHPLEFSRISGKSVAEIESARIETADSFAREYGVSILLKGARSVIAYGGTNKYVSLIATSALAVGGSGDALAGVIASLCAQGISLTDAAAAGCYIHGAAGLVAEKKVGARACMPDDIINAITDVFKETEK